ncbi:unnamed protein product [Parnassius mnemosyne]|uniref:Uncharacterized protein n=1 Tax=Parnassius mnemosyne TaxID=213953 RepID=A0AAV1KXP6_9NEOP
MLPMINLRAINSSLEMSSPVQLNLEGIDFMDLKFLSVALRKGEIKNSESEKAIVVIKSVSLWTILFSPVNENFELEEEGVMGGETHQDVRISRIF